MQPDLRPLREILDDYCKRGWFLFPVVRDTKRPAIKDNLKSASNDIEQLMQWSTRFPNCNWAVSLSKSGLVAVDIDEKGLDKWAALIIHNPEPETLKAASGSGRGLHYVFKADPATRYRGKLADGIDVKHTGYIVVYPSMHPRTKRQYVWSNTINPVPPPDWINKLIVKTVTQRGQRSPVYKFGSNFYSKIIQELKEKPFGYDEWMRMGMALHSAFQGAEEGLDLFLDLTEGINFKDGDIEAARAKWDSFKADENGVNAGTFVYVARGLGCVIPNPNFESDKELFAQKMIEEEREALDEAPGWHLDKYGRRFTNHIEFLVNAINEMGFAILAGDQEGTVIKTWHDDNGVLRVKTLDLIRFKTALASYHLQAWIPGADGTPRQKLIPASEMWMKSAGAQSYSQIVFSDKAPEGALNLWSGIPCKRIKGDPQIVLDYIRDTLCGGKEAKAQYLIHWMAHLVQKPHQKCSVVPALIGAEGTGKGLFTDGILRGLLSSYYVRIDKRETIMARFNVEQSRKIATVLDEACYGSDKELVRLLKSLTGNATITVEEKFGGSYTIEHPTRYVVTSNDREAIALGITNRRYLPFDVSSKHLDNANYYARLWDFVKGDGCAVLYDYLLSVDLSAFNPNVFPKHLDDGGKITKIESHGAAGSFWWEVLVENPVPIIESKMNCVKPISFMRKKFVYELFLEWLNKTKHWERGISSQKFWLQSRDLMPILGERDIRPQFNDGTRDRIFVVTPYDLINSYCTTLRTEIPDAFDDLELLAESDFQDQNTNP